MRYNQYLTSLTTHVNPHNKRAPYWAAIMIILVITGISTTWISWNSFWNGYVLDITGPAWNYILFRNLGGPYKENALTRFFTPVKTFFIFTTILYFIEWMQYFEVYESTYDPWDFVAYISLMLPFCVIDIYLNSN